MSKKQFCVHGHDTFIVGRSKNKRCHECERVDSLERTRSFSVEKKAQVRVTYNKWREANKEAFNAYHRNHYHTNINRKLSMRIRNRIKDALHGKAKAYSAFDVLGCDVEFLKKYIESQFKEGMSWDNWNKWGWHIDHIIPLSKFDLTDKEQFVKAVNYTNLQPMWAHDNWSKGNRV